MRVGHRGGLAAVLRISEEAGCGRQRSCEAGRSFDHGPDVSLSIMGDSALSLERKVAQGPQHGGRVLGRPDGLGLLQLGDGPPQIGAPLLLLVAPAALLLAPSATT
jgi:hypothetical protein